jgi:hypothetical protein
MGISLRLQTGRAAMPHHTRGQEDVMVRPPLFVRKGELWHVERAEKVRASRRRRKTALKTEW